ncbi:Secretory carrier-associated membrane protein 6 [Coccomyxa sp. Obi]|nr:Secretory carrier-associated membrane protein 6 [Coccomyxa sp. Obi]
MFTLKKENPFASPEPFTDEVALHDDAERGFGASSTSPDVPSALGVGSNAWGGSGGGVGSSRSNGSTANGKDPASWEARLNAREEALKKREQAVAEAEGRIGRKNWPKCRPMLRHSISEDVPEKRRGLVWRCYWAWLLMAAGFSVDWITITMMFIASKKGLSDWLFCTLISGFGLPLSFFLWHRFLYTASITDGACRWSMFFLFCALQVGLAGWTFTGPPIVGKWAAGLFTMIDQFKGGSGVQIFFGICCIINMVLWALAGLLGFAVWGEAYAAFRSNPPTRPQATGSSSRSWVPTMPSMPGFGKKKDKLPLHVAMAGLNDNPPRG